MTFIEGKQFQDKRRNWTVYEKLPVDFSGMDQGGHLLKGTSYMIRERT
jgi:hypothetical protein